jgi:hypothetical protein
MFVPPLVLLEDDQLDGLLQGTEQTIETFEHFTIYIDNNKN